MEIVDATKVQCPMPIVKLAQAMKSLQVGQKVKIQAVDLAFEADIHAWCEQTHNLLIEFSAENGIFTAIIEKQN